VDPPHQWFPHPRALDSRRVRGSTSRRRVTLKFHSPALPRPFVRRKNGRNVQIQNNLQTLFPTVDIFFVHTGIERHHQVGRSFPHAGVSVKLVVRFAVNVLAARAIRGLALGAVGDRFEFEPI